MQKPTLRNLEHLLGYHLRKVSVVVQSDLATTLAAFDLRMITFTTLAVVYENSGLRQKELADALAIERSNLVMIVDELERRGLLLREPAATDRRAHAISLTETGVRLFHDAMAAVNRHENTLFDGLSARSRDRLKEILIEIERMAK